VRPYYRGDRLDRWVIVRAGEVIGVVWYRPVTDATDPRGSGFGRVDGEVCTSYGISGTVPPRDPDQDGIELDCMAGSQVAFRPKTALARLHIGEPFITANVTGIRETDDVLPPDGVDGSDGWDGIWTVEREGKIVASIDYQTLDGISCRFSGIGGA